MTHVIKRILSRTGQCPSRTRFFERFPARPLRAPAWLAPALLIAGSMTAMAQTTTADILGTVSDPTGAIVPNATVKLTDMGTQTVRTIQANAAGEFDFTLLQPGRYSVVVTAPGFSSFKVGQINVNGGDHARADAKLTLGAESQTVEVDSQSPLLQADSVNVTTTITTEAVQNLPTAQRNLTSLVILTPGANEAATVDGLSSGARPDDRRLSSSYSINGEDSQLNNNQIDGTDNNERIIGTIGVKPLLDAIEEVTVQTNDFTPETGRSAGGVISVLTKRGSNQFHGTAYEYLQNSAANAKNPFAAAGPTPELRQNDFGGSIGGPIFKDKTFFFGAAEGFRLVSAANTPAISTVPTAAQEANPAAIVAADPYTAGLALDPIAVNLLKLYPAPNYGGGALSQNYIFQPKSTNYAYTVDGRIDHQFNTNNQLFARYTSNHVNALIPTALPNVVVGGVSINPGNGQYGFAGPATDIAYNGQLDYLHTFTPNLLVELRAAYTRIDNESNSPNSGTNAATALGFPGNIDFSAASSGLPLVGVAGFNSLGDSNFVPIADLTNTYQYNGTVSYTKGKHALRFGAESIRRQARNQQSSNVVGNINFGLSQDGAGTVSNAGTLSQAQSMNNNLATFLVGGFTGEGRNIDLYTPNYRTWEPGFFAQDTWRATQNLTVVYGARYDFYTPFTEADGRISNYDPTNHVLLVPQKGYAFLQSIGANLSGVQASTPTAGIKTTYSNIAPRVGFADTVFPGTVVRGGFGMAYFPGNYTSNASLKNAPFNAVYSPSVGGTACQSTIANQIVAKYNAANASNPTYQQTLLPACQTAQGQTTALNQGIPVPPPQGLNSPNLSLGDNVAQNFRSSYVIQYNILVEQQFGKNVVTMGYVGQGGRHLPATINDINVPDPNTSVIGKQLTVRPTATILPGLGGVGEYYSIGSSSYNSLQVSFQRRLSQGLTITSNYTWSHAVDDVTDLSLEGQEGWGNLDPFNISKYETGSSDLDLRNRFVFAGNYELPFYKTGSGFKRALLGGFQTNAIWIWNSGSPFSITDNYTGLGNSIYGGIGGGPTRPLQIGNPHLNGHTINQWFNPLAFEVPQPGQFGNTSRNSLTGPTFEHFDFSVFKTIAFGEKYNLELRAESFNLTNTAGYFVPNNQNDHATTNAVGGYVSTGLPTPGSGFAQIVSTNPSYVPRELQLAAKFRF
jgi:hypothetical protein